MEGGAGVGLYIGKMDRKWLSRVLIIMLADILGILGSYLLALWARFDFTLWIFRRSFCRDI